MIAQLLAWVKAGIDGRVQVLVLADRGIGTSPALCRVVESLGWHYLFRVTGKTKILTEDGEYTIAQQGQVGEVWAASGWCSKSVDGLQLMPARYGAKAMTNHGR
jgi:hypothetical protein